MAAEPPIVVKLVPVATGGHQPSSRTCCHNWANVKPGSTRMRPVSGFQSSTRFMRRRSTMTFSLFMAASP